MTYDEFDSLVACIGDIIDGFEAFQVPHADPFIEAQLADLRYVRDAEVAEFTALCDQTVVGWQRFNGPGEPPDKVMGLLYDGFVMPPREALGDADPAQWEEGLAGEPQDPWQHTQLLVLQDPRTSELFTFATSSKTGRRAVGTLLKHYDRMQKTNPGELPVVRLRTGGFQHRDDRIGFVTTPVFVVCGRQSRDSVAQPDTSIGANIDDAIPF